MDGHILVHQITALGVGAGERTQSDTRHVAERIHIDAAPTPGADQAKPHVRHFRLRPANPYDPS